MSESTDVVSAAHRRTVQRVPAPVKRHSWDVINTGDSKWLARGERWCEIISAQGAALWFDPARDPRATRLKVGQDRSTWRIDLGNGCFVAKVFDSRSLIHRVGRWFGADPAHRAWKASRRAVEAGLPVAECVAIGRRHGPCRTTVLLYPYLDRTEDLGRAWRRVAESNSGGMAGEGAPGSRADALIRVVARVIADTHKRGFLHRDLHPGNILIRGEGPTLDAFLIDVHQARIRNRPTALRESLRALAQLDQYFQRHATQAQRLRFLSTYLARRPSVSPAGRRRLDARRAADTLAVLRRRLARRLVAKRDRRLTRNGKYFTRLPLSNGWHAVVTLTLERRHAFPEPNVPDRTVGEWRDILDSLLMSNTTGSAPLPVSVDSGLSACVTPLTKRSSRLHATLGASDDWAAFRRCHALRHRNRPAELILAYAEHRSGLVVDATLLVRPSGGAATPARVGQIERNSP